MDDLLASVDRVAHENAFSGVVRVDLGAGFRSTSSCCSAYANRPGWRTPRSFAPMNSRAAPRSATSAATSPGPTGSTYRSAATATAASTRPLADIHALWVAFFAGRIVSVSNVAEMVKPRSEIPEASERYGLGFWLPGTARAVELEGYDAGVSFRTVHDPETTLTYTVIANTSEGAWPMTEHLAESLATRTV